MFMDMNNKYSRLILAKREEISRGLWADENFPFLLLTESGISFCPEKSVRFGCRAKRGEPSKLAISSMVRPVGLEPTKPSP